MTEQRQVEKILYWAGWLALAAVLVLLLLARRNSWQWQDLFAVCPLWQRRALYCPGCGGRHAWEALRTGRLLQSLYYHPLLLYGWGWFAAFMVSHTWYHASRGRLPRLAYRNAHIMTALALLLWNFILHNALWLWFGVTI